MRTKTASQKDLEFDRKVVLLNNLKMVFFLLIIGLISAGLLVSLKSMTQPLVDKNKEVRLKENLLKAFNLEYRPENVERVFQKNIAVEKKGGINFYKTNNGDVAFRFEGKGLWGPITGIIALKPGLEKMKGISIIEQEETPGLGGRITEKEFQDQFRGLKVVPSVKIIKASKGAANDNEVDAITGATLTSKAMETILNSNIKLARKILEVKQNE